jgi:hypothetical protein
MNMRSYVLVAVALVALAAPASASVIEIQLTGLDLVYDGTKIVDARAANSIGQGIPAESDLLTTMVFLKDGVKVGVIENSNIFADVFINNVKNIPAGGGLVTSGGNSGTFGFDLLTQNSTPGWGLALNIDKFQVFYTGYQISMAAAGVASSVFNQNLPFGLGIDPNDQISIVVSSTNLSSVTDDGTYLTGFNASSTGSVKGTFVPEPATLALIGGGALMALVARRRRRA